MVSLIFVISIYKFGKKNEQIDEHCIILNIILTIFENSVDIIEGLYD